jgi:hypothetical protein
MTPKREGPPSGGALRPAGQIPIADLQILSIPQAVILAAHLGQKVSRKKIMRAALDGRLLVHELPDTLNNQKEPRICIKRDNLVAWLESRAKPVARRA